MSKIIVTGGSGFFGTNLVEHYSQLGWDVINIDIAEPRNPLHRSYWKKADIRDTVQIQNLFSDIAPDIILHMAARTDLLGQTLEDYSSNTDGVASIIQAASHSPRLGKVVFASSMLVCPLGYMPKDEFDVCPTTVYGRSKAVGEKHVREMAKDKFAWSIVRPTSLWGPWFGIPYKDFFSAVAKRRYVHPQGRRIHRSYGFALNATYQVQKLAESSSADNRVFYLADYAPIELLRWSHMISNHFQVPHPREVPLTLLKGVAKCGDAALRLGFQRMPLTSSRLNNLLTDAVYDLTPLREIASDTPYSVETAVGMTVEWMKKNLEK